MGDQGEFDVKRDQALIDEGLNVVRILAADVLHEPETVAESMVRHCLDISTPSGATH